MLTAKTIMNTQPEHCMLDTPIDDIMQRFAQRNIDYILVLDDEDRLCGIITESDLIDQQANLHIPTAMSIFDMVLPLGEDKFEREIERLQALTAKGLMVTDLQTVTPETSLSELASLMSEVHVHHLPVIDGSSVEGLVSKHDVIKALASQ
ncbi:MAG: CBS domain-containing protein [Ghiorsea sp.]|nr:CBS domain-containing protein [Ghiorsea sp.]PCI02524.1 MAG: CBS domain-containing protein [Zetaproteobacteria bacterium]